MQPSRRCKDKAIFQPRNSSCFLRFLCPGVNLAAQAGRGDFGWVEVSALRTFLPQHENSERPGPAFDVGCVAAGGGEVLHVTQVPRGTRFPGPMQFRNDKIFLAHDPGIEVFKFDALTAAEFHEAIIDLLADDAIHFNAAFPVAEVEE